MTERISASDYKKLVKGNSRPDKTPKSKPAKSEVDSTDDEPLMSGQYQESEIRRVFDCLTDAKVLGRLREIGFYYVDSGAEELKISNGKTTYKITIK